MCATGVADPPTRQRFALVNTGACKMMRSCWQQCGILWLTVAQRPGLGELPRHNWVISSRIHHAAHRTENRT